MKMDFTKIKNIATRPEADDSIEQVEDALNELQQLKNCLEILGVTKGNTYLALEVAKAALLERRTEISLKADGLTE